MKSVVTSIIRREFLGWDRPALAEAARRLAERYRRGDALELGSVLVVLPGQRAGRRFLELVAFLAEDQRLRLTPPLVTTEGRLPEMLYAPKLPFAPDLVQDLAWSQALRDLTIEMRQHLLPHAPAADAVVAWLEVGRMLRRLHVELAADGLDFAAVNSSAKRLANFVDAERWQTLVMVQRRYLDLLDREKLWDIQTARLKAIELREIQTVCDVILLGTVDLNNSLRQMLELIAPRVTAFIAAPEDIADQFDRYGCLVPSVWSDANIPLRDDQLHQVDGAAEQAEAVSTWLACLGGRFRRDEITIGVADESLVPQLQRELGQQKLPARWVEGKRVGETAPYRLLAAALRFASGRRYDDLAALVRHSDVEDWLQIAMAGDGARSAAAEQRTGASLPSQLDLFYNARLPSRMRTSDITGEDKDWPGLATALGHIETWLDALSTCKPFRAWGELFRSALGRIYAQRTLNRDEPADDALERTLGKMLERCAILDSLPEALDNLPVSAWDAFHFALGPLADEALPPPGDAEALELLGWLELPLDDAPALIVTSFNEGFVPKSAGADAFLPDRLRCQLGLLHNERRYARDAYATSVLCHSRQELLMVAARRDTKKDPLLPSRLLFACPDDALIRRARRFFGEQEAPATPRRLLLAPSGAVPGKSLFKIPEPWTDGKPPERFSVTEFKTYLACPYRYYLRRVRKLEAIDDHATELDGGAFGTLLHKVLGRLGRDPAGPRHSDRPDDIRDYLVDQLRALVLVGPGADNHRPAIRLQLELARARLHAFALRQAELVREGWRIVYVEGDDHEKLSIRFPIDSQTIELVGRIDRIDFHEATRRVRIVDYKTADQAQTPGQTHRSRDSWIDLQLPLYRHLWRAAAFDVPADCAVELAYFNMPKHLDDAEVKLADWDDALLESADDEARRVIRQIRAGEFLPMAIPPPPFNDDLAAICLDGVYGPPALLDEDAGGNDAGGGAA